MNMEKDFLAEQSGIKVQQRPSAHAGACSIFKVCTPSRKRDRLHATIGSRSSNTTALPIHINRAQWQSRAPAPNTFYKQSPCVLRRTALLAAERLSFRRLLFRAVDDSQSIEVKRRSVLELSICPENRARLNLKHYRNSTCLRPVTSRDTGLFGGVFRTGLPVHASHVQ